MLIIPVQASGVAVYSTMMQCVPLRPCRILGNCVRRRSSSQIDAENRDSNQNTLEEVMWCSRDAVLDRLLMRLPYRGLMP